MERIVLYNHGGSANHGCEAIVRTLVALLKNSKQMLLLSEAPQEDLHYDLQKIIEIRSATGAYSKFSPSFLKAYLQLKRIGDYFGMDLLPYKQGLKSLQKTDLAASIGGDIYCYKDYPKFIKLHQLTADRVKNTALIGCSMNADLFENNEFLADMKQYDFISARESLTYQLLVDAGINNAYLYPDTAFLLPKEEMPLPNGFQDGNTIGINVSPLITRRERKPGIVEKNFRCLIQEILERTDCNIALIPHVVWNDNDDRSSMESLYHTFQDTGRIVKIPDCNCMQLKGYIAHCRFFIGARTHATIAAYSSCVPTLVLGYSIKSRGIAKDLFGTDENFVIPVKDLSSETVLTDAFHWIWDNESKLRQHLEEVMPGYKARIPGLMSQIENRK